MAEKSRPLLGKAILVTRAREQAASFVARVEELGGEVVLLPFVEFAAARNSQELDRALDELSTFHWLVFTSQNAVRFFCERAAQRNVHLGGPGMPLIAAVGPETARAASDSGCQVQFVAQTHSGEGLASELASSLAGKRVLLPRSNLARREFPEALRACGAHVTEVLAYCTTSPDNQGDAAVNLLKRRRIDVATFASPSAVRHFVDVVPVKVWQKLQPHAEIATIGPSTSAAARQMGLIVTIEAEEYTMDGLARAIVARFSAEGVTQK